MDKILFTFTVLFLYTFLLPTAFAKFQTISKPDAEVRCLSKPTTPADEPCDTRAKNFLEDNATGKTLFVEGQTDRSIYDIISMDSKINRIEFNSYGGPVFMGDEVARIIRERKITTSVREGARCASLCALVYQAGIHREAHVKSWFGYHGMLDLSLQSFYEVKCIEVNKRLKLENEQLCRDLKVKWLTECKKRTDIYHNLIEQYGATTALYEDFKKRDPDPEWDENGNCSAVMPWQMSASEAVRYNIVSELKQ